MLPLRWLVAIIVLLTISDSAPFLIRPLPLPVVTSGHFRPRSVSSLSADSRSLASALAACSAPLAVPAHPFSPLLMDALIKQLNPTGVPPSPTPPPPFPKLPTLKLPPEHSTPSVSPWTLIKCLPDAILSHPSYGSHRNRTYAPLVLSPPENSISLFYNASAPSWSQVILLDSEAFGPLRSRLKSPSLSHWSLASYCYQVVESLLNRRICPPDLHTVWLQSSLSAKLGPATQWSTLVDHVLRFFPQSVAECFVEDCRYIEDLLSSSDPRVKSVPLSAWTIPNLSDAFAVVDAVRNLSVRLGRLHIPSEPPHLPPVFAKVDVDPPPVHSDHAVLNKMASSKASFAGGDQTIQARVSDLNLTFTIISPASTFSAAHLSALRSSILRGLSSSIAASSPPELFSPSSVTVAAVSPVVISPGVCSQNSSSVSVSLLVRADVPHSKWLAVDPSLRSMDDASSYFSSKLKDTLVRCSKAGRIGYDIVRALLEDEATSDAVKDKLLDCSTWGEQQGGEPMSRDMLRVAILDKTGDGDPYTEYSARSGSVRWNASMRKKSWMKKGHALLSAVDAYAKTVRPPRVICIGDVHGCSVELLEVLRKAEFRPGDLVLFLGDLVHKGPNSREVLKVAWEIGAIGVRGNHDLEYITKRAGASSATHEFGPFAWLQSLPLYISSPSLKHLFVHGGFIPGIPLSQQSPQTMTTLRSFLTEDSMRSPSRKVLSNTPWAQRWVGPYEVLFGHDAKRGLTKYVNAIGLDGGAVYGGKLAAVMLPGGGCLAVDAKKVYMPLKIEKGMETTSSTTGNAAPSTRRRKNK